MHEDIKSVLITEEQIKKRVQEMGEQLSKEYEGKRVIIICLLKGAAFFACDLSRAMSIPVRMEFMVASSYGDGTTTSGSVAVRLDVKDDIAGMHEAPDRHGADLCTCQNVAGNQKAGVHQNRCYVR